MPYTVNAQTSVVPVLFLALGTIFLVVSSMSAPIIKNVALFRLVADINGLKRYVNFGIVSNYVEGPSVTGGCSRMKLGYTIDGIVTTALHAPVELQNALHEGHTTLFVVYPIASFLTFLSLLISIVILVSKHNPRAVPFLRTANSTAMLILVSFSTLVVTITFFITIGVLATVAISVSDINKRGGGLKLRWGGPIWFTIIAILGHVYCWIFLSTLREELKQQGPGSLRRERTGTEVEARIAKVWGLLTVPCLPREQ